MLGVSMTARTCLLSVALFFVAVSSAQAQPSQMVNKTTTECFAVNESSCACNMSDGSGIMDLRPLRKMLGDSYA